MENSSKFRSLNHINEYTTLDERQFMRSECKMNEIMTQEEEDALYRERIRSQYHLENETLIARAKTAEIRCRQIGTLHKIVVKDFKSKLEEQDRKLQDKDRIIHDKDRLLENKDRLLVDKDRELQELRAKLEEKNQLHKSKQQHATEPTQQFESHDSLNDSLDIENGLTKTKRMHKCVSTPVLNSTKIQPMTNSKSNHEALKRHDSRDSSDDFSNRPSSSLKLKDENDNEIASSKEKDIDILFNVKISIGHAASKFFSISNLRNLVKSTREKNKKKFNEPTGKKPAKRLEYHPTNSGLKVFDSEDGPKHKQNS